MPNEWYSPGYRKPPQDIHQEQDCLPFDFDREREVRRLEQDIVIAQSKADLAAEKIARYQLKQITGSNTWKTD